MIHDCACENVANGRCICLHPPSIPCEFKFPASEKNISELKKIRCCSVQDEDRQEVNFCSNRRAVPTELTRMKMLVAVGFP